MAPRVLLITDPFFADDTILRCVAAVAGALPRGAFGVQLRDKRRPLLSLRVFALALRAVTQREGAWLVVNGDARLARDVGAEGVHLGREAGSVAEARATFGRRTWVSVAVHSDAEARRAAVDGADAVLVSPIFPTRPPSPLGRAKPARGVGALRAARLTVGARMDVYALGGVTVERVEACASAGASGVAMIRGLLGASGPAAAARAIHDGLVRRW